MGRHRWMYYATGLPGWMRFGFSPGWSGQGSYGLGPCATYAMTGVWPTPQAQAYWDAMSAGETPGLWPGPRPAAGVSRDGEVEMLKNQAEMLSRHLETVNKRITQLMGETAKDEGGGGEER